MHINPFIKDSPVFLERQIPRVRLEKKYKDYLGIDVGSILDSTDKINLYKCEQSGYRFYHPFTISGDSAFYEKLQERESYYMDWKWEHGECLRHIREYDKILEVGCGKGDFLKNISARFHHLTCVGLELNKSSAISNPGYEIINTAIEDYSATHESNFDIVCSFQVLEHISMVHDFLSANIRCIKDGGLLVISVPNNDSYLKYDKFSILNMPPHHMGLWTERSLKKIGEVFGLKFEELSYEPLQPYHFDYYIDLILEKYIGKYPALVISRLMGFLKIKDLIKKNLSKRAGKIKGHSILIIFRK